MNSTYDEPVFTKKINQFQNFSKTNPDIEKQLQKKWPIF